jgi:hypothetical protein
MLDHRVRLFVNHCKVRLVTLILWRLSSSPERSHDAWRADAQGLDDCRTAEVYDRRDPLNSAEKRFDVESFGWVTIYVRSRHRMSVCLSESMRRYMRWADSYVMI